MFMVGAACTQVLPDKISSKVWTNKEVLQQMQGKQNLLKNDQGKAVRGQGLSSFLSCPLKTKSMQAKCQEPDGCQSGAEPCLVWTIKFYGGWLRSGLPLMADRSIADKAKRLLEKQKLIEKGKNKKGAAVQLKRDSFEKFVEESFDITHPNTLDIIKADKKRTKEAMDEDIKFVLDLRGPRDMCMTDEDKKY